MEDSGARSGAGDYVTAFVAGNPVEAQMIASLFEGAGISTYVEGALLNDEFAASRRLANTMGVEIRVPSGQRERARLVLADYESERGVVDPESLANEALTAADPEEFEPRSASAAPRGSPVECSGPGWMRRHSTALVWALVLIPALVLLVAKLA